MLYQVGRTLSRPQDRINHRSIITARKEAYNNLMKLKKANGFRGSYSLNIYNSFDRIEGICSFVGHDPIVYIYKVDGKRKVRIIKKDGTLGREFGGMA